MQDENFESSNEGDFDKSLCDYFTALGSMTASWAMLEFSIDRLIWYLAETPDTIGACVTTQIMGAPGKIKALVALAHLRGGDEHLIRDLNRFEGKTRPLSEQRNRYTHDWWGWQPETGAVVQFTVAVDQKKLRFGFEERFVSEMKKLRADIEAARKRFDALAERVRNELSPSQDKWRAQQRVIHFD